MSLQDKRILDLVELETSENSDVIVIDDISAPAETRTKKQSKLNFLKEIVATFANYFTKTEANERFMSIDFEESDPIFTASPAYTITNTKKNNWDTAYSWGNHAGRYDLLGVAQDLMNDHEDFYDHTLIATALQKALADTYYYPRTSNPANYLTPASKLSDLVADSGHRTVSDTEKNTWNAKQDALDFNSETPQGIINGINKDFTTTENIHFIIGLHINGMFIHPSEYTFANKLISFLSPLDSSLSGTGFTVVYF